MQKFWSWLAELVYPRFCLGCGRPGELVCDRCYNRLNFTLSDDLCADLFANWPAASVYLQKVQAVVVYDQLVQKILHHYKYLGGRDLAKILAYWLYEFVDWGEIDVITYIPIHRRRRRERGYNQAELIARELARLANLPCQVYLTRPVYKTNQALSKNKAERLTKTQGIFASLPHQWLPNQRVLIIDDVVTSGATLNEAARVLRESGCPWVQALAVAHGE